MKVADEDKDTADRLTERIAKLCEESKLPINHVGYSAHVFLASVLAQGIRAGVYNRDFAKQCAVDMVDLTDEFLKAHEEEDAAQGLTKPTHMPPSRKQ